MLFSDIRNFTYRTETLGNDIIDLLNVHYRKVIKKVHENSGVIGSIIGDAILAVYGTQETASSKSLNAVDAAWQITQATAQTRSRIIKRREELEKSRPLTEEEEKIYKAVLIDIGVGIDGGTVFYGCADSTVHFHRFFMAGFYRGSVPVISGSFQHGGKAGKAHGAYGL